MTAGSNHTLKYWDLGNPGVEFWEFFGHYVLSFSTSFLLILPLIRFSTCSHPHRTQFPLSLFHRMVDGSSVVQMTALYIFGTWYMLPYNADCWATNPEFGLLILVRRVNTWHVAVSLG